MMLTRRDTLIGGLCALSCPLEAVLAVELSYALSALEIAPNTYVVLGKREYFTKANGGDIVNVAFIDTEDGVVVIDTGSSKRYGEALRHLIERTVGKKDIVRVYNTHHHPDHFLGNQAFGRDTIASTAKVAQNIEAEGEALAENLYRLLGDWMRGTHAVAPSVVVTEGEETFGDHRFELIELKGHTNSDLAILDKKTDVLFAGDLAFLDRAPTTPHANLSDWQDSLDALVRVPHKLLVPGHGEPDSEGRAIAQTRNYLLWLSKTFEQALNNGLDMTEVMSVPIPEQFSTVALAQEEMERSVSHLYPKLEDTLLPYIGQGEQQGL